MVRFFLCTPSIAVRSHWESVLENEAVTIDQATDLNAYAWDEQTILLIDIQHRYPLAEALLGKSLGDCIPKIFALTGEPDLNQGLLLLKQGVKGYGNAFLNVQNFKTALDVIQGGHIWIYPELVHYLILQTQPEESISPPPSLQLLTQKEKETAQHIAKGKSNKEVANAMEITERTVKAHLSAIYAKLDINDRFSLALLLKGIHE